MITWCIASYLPDPTHKLEPLWYNVSMKEAGERQEQCHYQWLPLSDYNANSLSKTKCHNKSEKLFEYLKLCLKSDIRNIELRNPKHFVLLTYMHTFEGNVLISETVLFFLKSLTTFVYIMPFGSERLFRYVMTHCLKHFHHLHFDKCMARMETCNDL